VKSFFWRWQRRLPSPFTRADLRAGYVYELAFRQFEISDTRVFDHPAAGRAFLEGLIRDHRDVGGPALVSVIFGRRVDRRTRAASRPRSSPKAWSRRCAATTAHRASNSISFSPAREQKSL
jgi:hypothetical protein